MLGRRAARPIGLFWPLRLVETDAGAASPSAEDGGARLGLATLTECTQNEINEISVLKESHMTGNLHVRNLDDDLIARLKRRAQRHGRSTEAEHREILRQVLTSGIAP
jgi:hypothetical protein